MNTELRKPASLGENFGPSITQFWCILQFVTNHAFRMNKSRQKPANSYHKCLKTYKTNNFFVNKLVIKSKNLRTLVTIYKIHLKSYVFLWGQFTLNL